MIMTILILLAALYAGSIESRIKEAFRDEGWMKMENES